MLISHRPEQKVRFLCRTRSGCHEGVFNNCGSLNDVCLNQARCCVRGRLAQEGSGFEDTGDKGGACYTQVTDIIHTPGGIINTEDMLGIPQIHKHRQAAMTSKYRSIPVCRIHLSEHLKTLIMAAQGGLQGALCCSLTPPKKQKQARQRC